MDADVTGSLGINFETRIANFVNKTGGTITKGYVGAVDILGASAGSTLSSLQGDGPNYRLSRMVGPLGGAFAASNNKQGWFGVLLDDSLSEGHIGKWLMQGYVEHVQVHVSAAESAASVSLIYGVGPSATPTLPDDTWPGILGLNEDPTYEGMLGLRDVQASGIDAERRGIFLPDAAAADDTISLIPGLFMGLSENHFGYYHGA